MGGRQFFDFMGGHRAHGGPPVPPTKEIPGVWFRKGKNPHTVTLVLLKQKVHLSIVSFRHTPLSALWSFLGTLRRCGCPTEASIFRKLFRNHFLKNIYFDHTDNKTNFSGYQPKTKQPTVQSSLLKLIQSQIYCTLFQC